MVDWLARGAAPRIASARQNASAIISCPTRNSSCRPIKLLCLPKNGRALVHRLANNGDVAGGQLAVFQGASEAPISESYGSSEQRGKTANWPRPGGLR